MKETVPYELAFPHWLDPGIQVGDTLENGAIVQTAKRELKEQIAIYTGLCLIPGRSW